MRQRFRRIARIPWRTALVIGAPALVQAAVASRIGDALWIVLASCATLAGWRWLSSGAAASPEATASRVLLPCTVGMLAGFAWDARGVGLPLAASLCGATHDIGAALWLHWRSLPAMHVGMLAGGMATAWPPAAPGHLREAHAHDGDGTTWACRAGCCVAMLAGAAAGAVAAAQLAGLLDASVRAASSPVAMLGGMFAGMTWGMAGWAWMRRGAGALRRFVVPASRYRDGQHRPIRP
ncbi:hypothetical protein ACVBGC_12120 [Burkholderia stagnalis]